MDEVSIIGIDLAKRSFQVHGAKADHPDVRKECGIQLRDAGVIADEVGGVLSWQAEFTDLPRARPTSASRSAVMICSGVCRFLPILTSSL